MVKGHNSQPGPTTEQTLSDINNCITNLVISEADENDKKDAEFLQNFLNRIMTSYSQQNQSNSIAEDAYDIFINNIVNQLRQNSQRGRDIFKQTEGTRGQRFEADFAELIKTTFEVAFEKEEITNLAMVVGATSGAKIGSMQTNITGALDPDETIRKKVKDSYTAVGEYIKKYVTKDLETDSTYTSVDGKIDNTGLGYSFNIVAENEHIKRILQLLNQSGFTLKDYRKANVEISSQGANFYRTFYTLASKAQISNIDTKFWRMITCITNHEGENGVALIYISRLRLMYELTGVGQNYTLSSGTNAFRELLTGVKGGARFIIRLDGTQIYVQPTSVILKEYLEEKPRWMRDNLFKDINTILYGSLSLSVK